MSSAMRRLLSIIAAALLLSQGSFAFDTPLSDQAVREAYFLGQRRDETMAAFLNKYSKYLEAPKTGPHVASVTFFTPFALLVQQSSQHTSGYSAQQAALDHRDQPEFVRIIVQIQLTNSYGAYIIRPTSSRSGSSAGFVPRPYDFWKDFDVQIYGGDQSLSPSDFDGHANYSCGRRGPCVMTGATLKFKFRADAFTSDSATIRVDPPEGDPVSVGFDLIRLR